MRYEVINKEDETVIMDNESGLKVRVTIGEATVGTAFCLGTLYMARSSFVPTKIYVFQVMGDDIALLENIKNLAVFFFASLLDTELFIVEIPRSSALFPQEAERIFGEINYERAV